MDSSFQTSEPTAVREPSDSSGQQPLASARRALVGSLLFAAAVVLPLLRQRGTRTWDTLWGEDGFAFYGQAIDAGPLDVLFRGYAGYLVLPPRLFSLPAPWLPVDHLALYYALVGVVVTALLALFVYHSTRDWIASRLVRLALASLVVLMPAAGVENTGSTTNTIWAFAAVAPWAIVSLRERPLDLAARSTVVFLAATGLPLTFVLAPLAVGWVWIRRTRAAVVVAASLGAGLVAQALVMWRSSGDLAPITPRRPVSDIADLVGHRLFGQYVVGPDGAISLADRHGLAAGIVAALVFLAVFVVGFAVTENRARLLGSTFFVLGVAEFFVLIWWRGTLPFRFGTGGVLSLEAHMRYSVPPTLMLASALAVLLSPMGEAARSQLLRIGRAIFVAHVAVVSIVSFRVDNLRSTSPSWPSSVAKARAECADLAPEATVEIPQDAVPFFRVVLPCRDL